MTKFLFSHDRARVLEHLHSVLDGAHVNLFTYGYTYWDVDFVSKDLDPNKLSASEILVPDSERWWASLNKPPIDLEAKGADANDTLAALVLTHSMNSLVQQWALRDDNSLEVQFENGGWIIIPPVQDPALGFSWHFRTEKSDEASICNVDEVYYRYRL